VAVQHLFNLCRVNVVSPGDDEIPFAIHEEDIAVIVHDGDIPGIAPPVP
jgi:hypothetical protein